MKPFDITVLLQMMKDKGMVAVEADVKIMTNCVFDWLEASLAAETNPMYKLLSPAVDMIRPLALSAEDKIDGIVGN